ncbi:hypothetical protein AAFF_G00174770 [Aldrovandia affinis]|uniref:Uncharacterized protein n=1 Tax=Aldrovandia affinis TaxID=143900 RepID=A0AAD7RL34_9TELE|nr:hypothetical protein AAFF_G00174770 [Aldrovandia affinis]
MTTKPAVRVKAKSYTEAMLKCETILTAQVLLRIFEETSPVSKKKNRMDILTAHRLVKETEGNLKKCVRAVEAVKKAADSFVEWANAKLQEKDDCEVKVQALVSKK